MNHEEITLEQFKKMTKPEKDLITFVMIKDINDNLKKKCPNCATTRNQKWIIRVGAAIISWLAFLTFRG